MTVGATISVLLPENKTAVQDNLLDTKKHLSKTRPNSKKNDAIKQISNCL